jgi:ribosomal protein L7/L12
MSEPLGPGTLEEIRRLLAGPGKIQAIKRYREVTGAGLAEAKAAVERLGAAPAPAAPGPISAEVQAVGEALRAGNMIEAIRLYRAATGAGLEAAKHAIDALMAEKRAGPKPAAAKGRVIERRRLNPVLVLLGVAALFGTVFGLALVIFAR